MLKPILIAAALTACVQPDELELGSTAQEANCPVSYCGGNSPLLGPFKADELNEDSTVTNTAGLRLEGYVGRLAVGWCTDARPCRVDVRGDDLIVLEPNTQTPGPTTVYTERTGNYLTGGYLKVWQPGDPSATNPAIPPGYAKINIESWSNATTFWQGAATAIDTYGLSYEIPGVLRGAVCGNPPPATDGEGNTWVRQFDAVFFAGDRYRHDRMEVAAATDVDSGNWFNIACAGSATMKLHLNRHTTAGSTSAMTTTLNQRQTMLKMFTGDFCGDGTTYTVQGTRIEWRTNNGLSGPIGPGINSFESYWNENGAVCLTRHRLASSTDPALAAMESEIRNRSAVGTCRQLSPCNMPAFQLGGRRYYLRTSSAALP